MVELLPVVVLLPTSVFPFILRGVSLLGVDSVELPLAEKNAIWNKFSSEWQLNNVDNITKTIGLEDSVNYLPRFMTGQVNGRMVVKLY